MSVFSNEAEFRSEIKKLLESIEQPLQDLDPDLIEYQNQFGAMTLVIRNKTKWVVSAQPSVQQVWLALASLGRAHHFNFDADRKVWVDDKDPKLEFKSLFSDALSRELGQKITLN